ncbi:uncharacterized protein LOC143187709 [Calliopsis andreniformis]|uniref:uncharacterized protein LOC143187709 n=1 Tax=Calliopsis andreniformis TaxID=337506 RepID=UPI003FCC3F81
MHCSYDTSLSSYQYRRDIDCVSWFIQELKNLAQTVKSILSNNISMAHLTKEQWDEFHNVIHYHICEKPFDINETRVRYHCHLTGRDRGPTHVDCNINYKNSFHVPIAFHNLSGYDSHFIIMELANAFEGYIDLLPITKEKYISVTKHLKDVTEEELCFFGVFPYEYIDCFEKLEDSCLPSLESFYSSLTDEIVSESDYAHAENIWHSFEIKTLADIFENFRESCIKSYGLDQAHYYTLPGFIWDAMMLDTFSFKLIVRYDNLRLGRVAR